MEEEERDVRGTWRLSWNTIFALFNHSNLVDFRAASTTCSVIALSRKEKEHNEWNERMDE